jgi:60 kDa SS-A/Ro ribonucleoprotein
MYRSLEGQAKLKGRTALVVDTSPSMWMATVSAKSEMDRFEAAAALANLCREVCEDVTVYAFNERAYEVPARRGFALRDALAQTRGSASCGGLAVQMANERGYDRIVVLTDGQWHLMGQGRVLREADAKELSPAPLTSRAYMVNVANHQNGVGYGKWTAIDGWSEAIVTYIQTFEQTASDDA